MQTEHTVQASPVVYDPSMEIREEGEAETTNGLVATLTSIAQTTFADTGHGLRGVHAKSHGLLVGEIQVLDNLPGTLAQGMFAKPTHLPVVMRFSTIPGDILDDSISTPRGLAVKVVGVDGARLDGSEADVTQDFTFVNGPAFAAPGPRKFLGSLKLLAATTDKFPWLKKLLSAILRVVEKVLEALGGGSGTLKALGGHPETHILGETFYSQAPMLFGPYMAKVAIVPVSAELAALANAPLNVNGKPNGLRDAVVDFFATNTAGWELRVQLCTDLATMPIEDASVQWPESASPYVAVARITAKPQVAWSAERSLAIDDGMAFSPWHGLAAHRPIGSVMRVRKVVYAMSSKFRADHNGHAIVEPRSRTDLPA